FNGMTVFENLVVAAAFGGGRRERDVYGRCVEFIEQCGLAAKANRPAGSLTLLDRKRLELARALATQPRVLLLDEGAGGVTEHECKALGDLIRDLRRGRHRDHRDRAGRPGPGRAGRPRGGAAGGGLDGGGPPAAGDRVPRRARDLQGNPRRCLSRSSTCARSTPSTATSRRCSACRCARSRARWSPSSAPTAPASRRCSNASPA